MTFDNYDEYFEKIRGLLNDDRFREIFRASPPESGWRAKLRRIAKWAAFGVIAAGELALLPEQLAALPILAPFVLLLL